MLQARDPIPQFRDFVLKQSILSQAQIKDIDNEVEAIVDDAVKFADESPKPVSTGLRPLLLIIYTCSKSTSQEVPDKSLPFNTALRTALAA